MATKKKSAKTPKTRIQLIESDSSTPTITARPGVRIEIVSVATPEGKAARLAARLCGYGSGSCLAIVETE